MAQNEFNRKKVMLYSIGAGTVVLALMAFSGACWGVVRACDGDDEASIEFWEVFGVSAAAFMATMALRSAGLGRKRPLKFPPSSAAAVPDQRISVTPSGKPRQPGLQVPASLHSAQHPSALNNSWRDLCSQLSEEERQEMKALLGRYCNGSDQCTNNGTTPATSNGHTPAQADNEKKWP
ncbi:MAG: hypothetical protein JNJ94_13395 [Chlorobi bacterium]|nr:hypothetical protein [Chlorobiota bacterium]